jgi:hypothetical protein
MLQRKHNFWHSWKYSGRETQEEKCMQNALAARIDK